MNKKQLIVAWVILSIFLAGCAMTSKEKRQVWSDHPYHKTFNADAETVLNASIDALESLDWKIAEKERAKDSPHELTDKYKEYYAWVYTGTKEYFWGLYASNIYLNLFIKPISSSQVDVIILYCKEKAIGPFFDAPGANYKNDEYVNKIYNEIAIKLEERK